MKKVLLPLLSLAALTVSARSFDVKLWRGETTAVRMPDYAEIGKVPEGLKVRVGAMMPVNYQEKNDPRHVLTCLDRVDFTQDGGTRYVEVTAALDAKPDTQFFKEYWGPFLVDFAKHLKEKVIDDAKFAELVKVFDMKKALGSYDFAGAKMQMTVNR